MEEVNFIGRLGKQYKQQIKRISTKNKSEKIGISIDILLAVHQSRRKFGVVGGVSEIYRRLLCGLC